VRSSSAKAKGRRHQQHVAERLREVTGLPEADIHSTPMGTQGLDIKLSGAARERVPFGIECKNTEKINIWQAWEQAKVNAALENLSPLVVFSRNRSEVLVTMSFEDFLKWLR
jgi:hypothetical protein